MTALKGGIPDRVPCWPKTTRWVRHHYKCPCPRHQLKGAEEFGFDAIVFCGSYIWRSASNDYVYTPGGGYNYNPCGLYGDLPDVNVELRIENTPEHVWYHRKFHTPGGELSDVIQWARPNMGYGDGPNPHRVEPLVKTLADVDALQYLYPEPRKDVLADIPLLLEDVGQRALVAALDTTHAGSWGMEVLGPEEMLAASITDPELLRAVCRLANNAHLRNLRAMLEQGLGVVYDSWFQCGPSVGWSPKTYEEIFLPLIKETIELAHEFGALFIYQDDGKMRDIIPLLVEAGVDALAGLQPPDVGDVVLKETKEQYGSKIALAGGLDPCYVFDLGNPERVREAVRQAISDAGSGGGFVLGTAEAVSPDTSLECLHAMTKAVQDFGVY
jgi:uroporphyrinogen decarboxylase